jgi:hypothetical protein
MQIYPHFSYTPSRRVLAKFYLCLHIVCALCILSSLWEHESYRELQVQSYGTLLSSTNTINT